MSKVKRSCYNCKSRRFCIIWTHIAEDLAHGLRIRMISALNNETPGNWLEVGRSVARACLEFEYEEK